VRNWVSKFAFKCDSYRYSEMVAVNTALGDQLEGVLDLLKALNEQYIEEFNYRESLVARER
jgi:hypothetical protein